MIISASRRTDIPTFYTEWFLNRIKEKYVLVRNPMNYYQVSSIDLSPDVVDCIVFWTKNPAPMLEKLNRLQAYSYYFQFTLNSYEKDVEENIPSENGKIIDAFKRLSDKIGPEKVLWRYDPIFLNEKYTIEYHMQHFEKLAVELKDYTEKCTISFIDDYPKIRKNIAPLHIQNNDAISKREVAKNLSEIAFRCGLKMDICAEDIELEGLRISPTKCIDDKLIERIIGYPLKVQRDKTQRETCRCAASIDIGTYNTCKNGCKYCYANRSFVSATNNFQNHDAKALLLGSTVTERDKVSQRVVTSLKAQYQKH